MPRVFLIMLSSYGVTNPPVLATTLTHFATLSRHVAAFSTDIALPSCAVAPVWSHIALGSEDSGALSPAVATALTDIDTMHGNATTTPGDVGTALRHVITP